jgi:glyceraldehyde-3-phosphate dehydrogenase/erythrose-4-phosphate dehydrogenase
VAAEDDALGVDGWSVSFSAAKRPGDVPRSAFSTMVVDGTCVKMLDSNDNETKYVHRMIEFAQRVGAWLGTAA